MDSYYKVIQNILFIHIQLHHCAILNQENELYSWKSNHGRPHSRCQYFNIETIWFHGVHWWENSTFSLFRVLWQSYTQASKIPCFCNVIRSTYSPPVSVWNGPLTSVSSSMKELSLSAHLPPSLPIPTNNTNILFFQSHPHAQNMYPSYVGNTYSLNAVCIWLRA